MRRSMSRRNLPWRRGDGAPHHLRRRLRGPGARRPPRLRGHRVVAAGRPRRALRHRRGRRARRRRRLRRRARAARSRTPAGRTTSASADAVARAPRPPAAMCSWCWRCSSASLLFAASAPHGRAKVCSRRLLVAQGLEHLDAARPATPARRRPGAMTINGDRRRRRPASAPVGLERVVEADEDRDDLRASPTASPARARAAWTTATTPTSPPRRARPGGGRGGAAPTAASSPCSRRRWSPASSRVESTATKATNIRPCCITRNGAIWPSIDSTIVGDELVGASAPAARGRSAAPPRAHRRRRARPRSRRRPGASDDEAGGAVAEQRLELRRRSVDDAEPAEVAVADDAQHGEVDHARRRRRRRPCRRPGAGAAGEARADEHLAGLEAGPRRPCRRSCRASVERRVRRRPATPMSSPTRCPAETNAPRSTSADSGQRRERRQRPRARGRRRCRRSTSTVDTDTTSSLVARSDSAIAGPGRARRSRRWRSR